MSSTSISSGMAQTIGGQQGTVTGGITDAGEESQFEADMAKHTAAGDVDAQEISEKANSEGHESTDQHLKNRTQVDSDLVRNVNDPSKDNDGISSQQAGSWLASDVNANSAAGLQDDGDAKTK